MYVSITGVENNKDVYINQSYRKENGKTSSRIFRKLGKLNELLRQFDGDFDAMIAWAKSESEKDTTQYNDKTSAMSVSLSRTAYIPKNEERCFQTGYLFLQKLCTQLKIDDICKKISKRHRYTYDPGAILTDLIYARILSPSSRLSSFSYCKTLLEPPRYELLNVYRALSVMAEESDFIQEELYKKVLYYDCTNYYFEIEQADGIPLAFDIFPGNHNEQTTLKPLESKVIKDFDCSGFIFCSDAGLISRSNRRFNSFGNRSYVITQSLKKMRKEDRTIALDPAQFKKTGSRKSLNLSHSG